LDNTLIFLVVGDNGGSKEGTYTGTAGTAEKSAGDDVKFLLSQYDKLGTEYSYPNYPLGWSQATNTPFRYWKSDVNAEGASHTTLIVHYPKGFTDKGGLRAQYAHVTDILPTTIELTGVKVPAEINGYKQWPFHGTSLVYSLNDAQAAARHTQQYYELHGGRAIYKDGWKASVYHPRNTFGEQTDDINFIADFKRDKWELYNINEDWNELTDLAARYPEKLEALKKLFDEEAEKYNVYPLKNFRAGLTPPPIRPKTVIYEGTTIKTRVYIGKGPVDITAEIEAGRNAEGVIFANGGLLGGSSLYLKQNKLHYLLNDGLKPTVLTFSRPLKEGSNTVRIEFAADQKLTLFVNGEKAAEQAGIGTKYLASASSDGFSVGKDLNSPVAKDYPGTFAFNGKVRLLVIEQKEGNQEKVGLLQKEK